jgi:hypothetical protein
MGIGRAGPNDLRSPLGTGGWRESGNQRVKAALLI